jgi:hypothetical protein
MEGLDPGQKRDRAFKHAARWTAGAIAAGSGFTAAISAAAAALSLRRSLAQRRIRLRGFRSSPPRCSGRARPLRWSSR